MSSAISTSTPQSRLERISSLYDRNLFLQAYNETRDLWTNATRLSDLSIDELVLALRLASRLGGSRLQRWLSREALKREPLNPKVRYFTWFGQMRGRRYFDHLREIETKPELEGADPETQASWLGYSAMQWAAIRDFDNAHRCLALAHKWNAKDAWVLSCESDVLACQDLWDEALATAEAAWEISPGTPFNARSLGSCLLNLRRVEEAAERLAKAAEEFESYEVAHSACWYLAALAEMRTGAERIRVIETAQRLLDRATVLAPLADRETRAAMARVRLDLAELADDRTAIEHWAHEARSPFHRKVLENLRNNPNGQRIRLPFRHAIQRHNECLPSSIGSAMAAMRTPIDADAMAAELTFGGTPEWAAAEWLEKQGFVVRFFVARPQVTRALITNGFAFVMTLEWDTSAHAVAIVGLDEAAGTVMVHDPSGFRNTEYLIDWFGRNQAPLGPRGMVAVLPERVALLDQLLPQDDVETMSAREGYRRAEFRQGPAGTREVVALLAAKYPAHPNTRLLEALRNHDGGRIGPALEQFQTLLEEFPESALVRSNLMACCRSLRNTALMRKTLADVVERGILPGIEAQQQWWHPPADYVSEYGDLLRLSGATSGKARSLFRSLIARANSCASAWHNFADLLWDEQERESALLAYRVASCLADRNEHYARSYADALAKMDREEEGFAWLGLRILRFGNALEGVGTRLTLIAALEDAGHPERAMGVAQDALLAQGSSPDLLAGLVPFQARMGNWSEAEDLLKRLGQTGNTGLFHQASAHFHGIRGELEQALEHAEEWLKEFPLSMSAREEVVNLLARRSGNQAAIVRAREWVIERPGHESIEELYCRQLNLNTYSSWQKYSVLLRRVKRNREDCWAWLELAFCAIYDFELADEKLRHRLKSRIVHFLSQCDRTSPGEAPTLRAHAQWLEARGQWQDAVGRWFEAIERDPVSIYAYRHLWDCATRLSHEEQTAVWKKVEAAMLRLPGHLSLARDVLMMAARRFGVNLAEEAVARWIKLRPDDPEIVEAYIDLLLDYGHGRTDYERALQLILPELKRFPYHLGLRLSYAGALQNLGRFQEAEDAYREVVRRHPDNSWSRVRMTWMKQRRSETNAALQELDQAALRDPLNKLIYKAKAEILIEEQRFDEALEFIRSTSEHIPADVGWREDAIKLQIDCGKLEQAITTARGGVVEHPRGAYLWLLLGRTLWEYRQFAAPGEIESCLRRSLSLNPRLQEAADYLAMFLVEQRRYAEADQVLRELEERAVDPSPVLARLAWIRRKKGESLPAVEDMTSLVERFAWYTWAWSVLLEWFNEDKSWGDARRVLAEIVPAQRTNTRWRQRRLETLALAGEKAEVMDGEWNSLLHDFPEEMPLHLIRYDALCEGKRWPEAASVLQHIRAIYPDSPYVLARWVELLVREQEKDSATANLLQLLFAETEPSIWPPNHAWAAIQNGHYEQDAYRAVVGQLQQKKQPTVRAVALLADYVMERSGSEPKTHRPYLNTLIPRGGAREILKLLKLIDALRGEKNVHRAALLKKLNDFGYEWLVARYWSRHRSEVETGLETWSEAIRALAGLKKYRKARRVAAGWQKRPGVQMWAITNYVMCLKGSGKKQLKELRTTCGDALAGLAHDHCARYLAFREAEAHALLGDRQGFFECWKRHREYFEGRLEKEEWFETTRRYLLADIPALGRHLDNNEIKFYNKKAKSLRWEHFKLSLSRIKTPKGIKLRYWLWLFVVLWLLLTIIANNTR